MLNINENFLKLQNNYLFSTVRKKVEEYQKQNPTKKIINLGIGDVTLPIPQIVIKAMKKACDEMGEAITFKGYGPEQGYDFLKEKILQKDYESKGIKLEKDEIFVSDGSKCDTGNISDIFGKNNIIAITDPVYPVYLDSNVMAGRSGNYVKINQKYEKIVYLSCNCENNFIPQLPETKVDIIYLCYPNNPTGTVLTKTQLQEWVNYAIENKAVILFDAAYEAYITEPNIPHSIYEIKNAKKVAIEFKSFSKTAGFTGLRCSYTVIPKELIGYTKDKKEILINNLWNRRQCSKFNGVSYITQKGAEAIYTNEGKKAIQENIKYYLDNARIIKQALENIGFQVYGGINSPYIWLKTPNNQKSWEFFNYLLEKTYIVGTPGSGFGPSGEGYFRLTGFGSRENTIQAIQRFANVGMSQN